MTTSLISRPGGATAWRDEGLSTGAARTAHTVHRAAGRVFGDAESWTVWTVW